MKLRLFLLLTVAAHAARALAAEATATPTAAVPAATPPRPMVAARTAAPAVAAPRNESAIVPTATFESFRLITDRNIFNPNRTGRRDRSADDAPARLDVIALVGTIDSDKGLRAIFDGSDAPFRKALHVGESVDKFKVTQIASDVVSLERDGKTIAMRVGQQFRRPDGGDWNLVAADVVRAEAAAAAASATTGAGKVDPTAPVPIPANATPIERLMIERRNKQLKQ
jgi:hypothetical protein